MHKNTLICIVCKQEINPKERRIKYGILGKTTYRHINCKESLNQIKLRKFWERNPVTKIKKSSKIYDRNKVKRETKKELDNGQS